MGLSAESFTQGVKNSPRECGWCLIAVGSGGPRVSFFSQGENYFLELGVKDGTMTLTGILQEDLTRDMGQKGTLSLKPRFSTLTDLSFRTHSFYNIFSLKEPDSGYKTACVSHCLVY